MFSTYHDGDARLTIWITLKGDVEPLKIVNVFSSLARAKNVRQCLDDDIASAVKNGEKSVSINKVAYQVSVEKKKKKKHKPPIIETKDVEVILAHSVVFPSELYVAHSASIEVYEDCAGNKGWFIPKL